MEIQPVWWLAAWSLGIAASSLLGGWLAGLPRITHNRMQMLMAFVGGMIVGVATFHLLPHAIVSIPGARAVEIASSWLAAGMVAMLALQYAFDYHEHDFSEQHGRLHGPRAGGAAPRLDRLGWFGLAFGLGVHSLTEGLALGAAMRMPGAADEALAGFGVFLAIALHKPMDSLSLASVMRANGFGPRPRGVANALFALLCPLAAFSAWWAAAWFGATQALLAGCAMAFSAGAFLCIALSDLIPEIHFHRHDRLRLALCFLAGIAIAFALRWAEPRGLHGLHGL